MRHLPILVACTLTGCLAQVGPPVVPAGSPPAFTPISAPPSITVLPGTYTPSPLTDPTQAGFQVNVTPQEPCPGQEVVVEGRNFRNIDRVNAWLGSSSVYVAASPGDMFAPRGSVLVGSAEVDASGSFRLTFTLQPRMGPVSTGGELVLQPGQDLGLSFIGNGRPTPGGYSFRVGTACPGFSPTPLEAHFEPAAPCAGGIAHLVGTGFTGPTAPLEFAMLATRFGDGPRLQREAPIGADGKLDFAFDPAELKTGDQPFFHVDMPYDLTVYDPATNRSLHLPIPYCNAALTDALAAAPGFEPVTALTGSITRPSVPSGEAYEALSITSQADFDAWIARHQVPPQVVAKLPKIEFTSNQLLVVSDAHRSSSWIEIVAVAAADGGYRAYPVRWDYRLPVMWDFTFDLVVLPRLAGPVEFRPVADAITPQRPTTLRQQPRLELYTGNQPTITP